MPAKTPFRDRGIRRAPIINKRQPPVKSVKKSREGVILENPLLSDEVVPTDPQFYPSEPGVHRTDSHGRSSRYQPYTKTLTSQRPKVEIPPQLAQPRNLRRGRDLDDEGENTRPLQRQRTDEGIQYLQSGRSVPPQPVDLTRADFANSSGLELRPLAALRGRRVADYTLPREDPFPFGDPEPTISLRRQRVEEPVGRPRKRARLA
ncbi:hypothetical protein DFS34DRAFT_608406 [Phlyctochytrium arcticum]|nr:hypothetical protein DFS34DRAFT_608406 [Phlyctochytrium arcticum]